MPLLGDIQLTLKYLFGGVASMAVSVFLNKPFSVRHMIKKKFRFILTPIEKTKTKNYALFLFEWQILN